MKRGFESLAAALRVFARRNPEFFEGTLRKFLVIESKILSNSEFTKLFEILGERSDCYSAISPRKYKWICKPDFFSNEYISMLVQLLEFNLDCDKPKIKANQIVDVKPAIVKRNPIKRNNPEWFPKNIPDRFTLDDVVKIGGFNKHTAEYRITAWLKSGLAKREQRGFTNHPAIYLRTDKDVKPRINVKPIGPNRKTGRYNKGWILNQLGDEFTIPMWIEITGQTVIAAHSMISELMKDGKLIHCGNRNRLAVFRKTNPVPDALQQHDDQNNTEQYSIDQFTTDQLAAELKSRGYDITLHYVGK